MLTLKFYKNVNIDKDFNDVLYFLSPQAFETYLQDYLDEIVSDIPQYFDGKNEVVAKKYFEDDNYLLIYDTNSETRKYKFYFIDNVEFLNSGNVKYYLTLDVFHTYQYSITMKPSLMVKGHLNRMKPNPIIWTDAKSNTGYNLNLYSSNTNKLIDPYTSSSKVSIIAVIQTSNTSYIGFTTLTGINEIKTWLTALENLHLYGGLTTTFQIFGLYIIPNFDLKEKYNDLIPSGAIVDSYPYFDDIYLTSAQSIETKIYLVRDFYTYHYEGEEGQEIEIQTGYVSFIQEYRIASKHPYTTQSPSRLNNRYFIGTINNNQEIANILNDNQDMNLYLCINCDKQVEIILRYQMLEINLTNSFEIPFKNDDYSLYMNRNKATIEASNTSNALQLASSIGLGALGVALAPATAGLSAGLVTGAIGSSISYGASVIKQNATLKDARNQISRADNLNNGAILMLLYGVGCFEYTAQNDEAIAYDINKNGYECNTKIDTFKPSNISQNNFIYTKFNDIQLYGDFNVNIRTQLRNIFNKGVRIWYDTTNYLNDVNYYK